MKKVVVAVCAVILVLVTALVSTAHTADAASSHIMMHAGQPVQISVDHGTTALSDLGSIKATTKSVAQWSLNQIGPINIDYCGCGHWEWRDVSDEHQVWVRSGYEHWWKDRHWCGCGSWVETPRREWIDTSHWETVSGSHRERFYVHDD